MQYIHQPNICTNIMRLWSIKEQVFSMLSLLHAIHNCNIFFIRDHSYLIMPKKNYSTCNANYSVMYKTLFVKDFYLYKTFMCKAGNLLGLSQSKAHVCKYNKCGLIMHWHMCVFKFNISFQQIHKFPTGCMTTLHIYESRFLVQTL